tara:strand:+ start:382 stop:501 length:120 start_codon:yes stop_codon:yes gene_type:complete
MRSRYREKRIRRDRIEWLAVGMVSVGILMFVFFYGGSTR